MSMKPLLVALLATLALGACKNNEPDTKQDDAPAPTGLLGQAADKATRDNAGPVLPQPDPLKPLASYTELTSGQQIMFLYVAASRLPPDFTKLATGFSQEYRETTDSFRKNDLMQAIKPQLQQKIAEASASPYGWMDIDDSDNLGAYDFARKGFLIEEFTSERNRYYGDAYEYKLTWVNDAQVAFAPVADEAVARQLEAMRSGYDDKPRLKIFFFAQSADLNQQKVNALVTRVQITDKSGRVLAEYGPDGSVAVQTKDAVSSACNTGDAAACDAAQRAADAAAM